MRQPRHAHGFTMIELVVAMLVASIMVGLASMMLTTPIHAYLAQARRAELSDSAEAAMRSLSSDLRRALPNSVRIRATGPLRVVEMIDVQHIALFRTAGAGDLMTPGADTGFDTLIAIPPEVPNNGVRVVVGNLRDDDVANSAYRTNAGVITPPGAASIPAAYNHISINPAFAFSQSSAHRRAYIIGNVTRYRCDLGTGELRRVPALLHDDIDVGATLGPSELIARGVSDCSFIATPATAVHGGIVIVRLTVTRNADGNTENVRLVRQIPVENPS